MYFLVPDKSGQGPEIKMHLMSIIIFLIGNLGPILNADNGNHEAG